MFPRINNLVALFACLLLISCEHTRKNSSAENLPKQTAPAEAKKQAATDWNLSAIEGSKLKFRNGEEFDTKLHDLEFIGQMEIPKQAPYLVYAGRYCNECDARQMVYLARAGEPAPETDYGKNRLMHPGIMTDLETDEVLYKARAFYGQVLNNTTGLIWYQESLSDYGSYIPNIFLIKLAESGRTDTSFAFSNNYLQQTMTLLEKGLCKEIKGKEHISEP